MCPAQFSFLYPVSNNFVVSHERGGLSPWRGDNWTNQSFAFFPVVKATYQSFASLISIQEEAVLISLAALGCSKSL